MQLECFYHGTRNNWAYAYDADTVHLRVRTKRGDVETIVAVTGDKYDWDRFYAEYPMEVFASDALFDYWQTEVRPAFKRFSYGFRLQAGTETLWMTETGVYGEMPHPPGGYYDLPYIHEADLFTVPEWAKAAIFYQIMPDRFANGDSSNDPEDKAPWGEAPDLYRSYGGDLQGVMDHLDYLLDLGVTAIYFTPVFTAPSSHKYDTVDYMQVDPHFGTNDQLKQLVKLCHEKGLRVILDAVFNHCSEQFPHFLDVQKRGDKSPYADWFHVREYPLEVRDGIPTYDTFGFYGHMPKFNTAHPEVKQYLLGVAEYWVREIGIDGWRLDVANEIDHSFWREFRQTVKRANPEAYLVGEVWSDSIMWLLGDQFDSVMNYPFANKVLEFFSPGSMDGQTFSASMGHLLMRYPKQTSEVIFNMLGSHDTPRVLTRVGEDKRRLKLCVVFLLTYIGTPCIFYGDEVGLKGGDDPECRPCMEWDPDRRDNELFDFYTMLIHLRTEHPALRRGYFRFLKADPDDRRILYERIDEERHFTIWMNNTEEETVLEHPMDTSDWRDALTGEDVRPEGGTMRLQLEPLGYRILTRELKTG